MQYDDGGDHSDFWGDDQPTRQLRRVNPGTREHTGSIPIVPSLRRARDAAHDTTEVKVPRAIGRPTSRRDEALAAVSPRRAAFAGAGSVDPLLRRLGLVVGAIVLLIPLAMTLRPDSKATLRSADAASQASVTLEPTAVLPSAAPVVSAPVASSPVASSPVASSPAPAAVPQPDVVAQPVVTPAPAPSFPNAADLPPAVPAHTQPPTTVAPTTPTTEAAAPASQTKKANSATTVLATVEAESSSKACSLTYTVVSGDFWIGIAQRAQVPVKDLLQANNAKSSTKLFPGRTICLPKSAVTPVPAATPAPTTTVKASKTTTSATTPATTPKSAPKAPTTPVPTTTVKPTPTTTPSAPAPRNSYTREQVAQIIRDVWPDDLEDEAIRIATRESNLIPTVRNYCCFGLFQIYYSMHKRWLADLGITSADMLYDPRANATAALALYNRAGGWGPWAL